MADAMKSFASAVAVAALAALSACSGFSPAAPSTAAFGTTAALDASSAAACPAPGRVYTVGKASAPLLLRTAFTALGPLVFVWTVTFKNQATSAAPVQFQPIVYGCGAAKRRYGSAKSVVSTLHSSCSNGVCTVTVTYRVQYTPPAAGLPALPLRYVFVKFYPSVRKPGYGLMNGALVILRKHP
jgi:hypothetical protein